jgi:hypothetical protein
VIACLFMLQMNSQVLSGVMSDGSECRLAPLQRHLM